MNARRDVVGETFGRLTVVCPAPGPGRLRWLCRCACGAEVSVQSTNLYCGNTQSCGCLRSEVTSRRQLERYSETRHAPVLAYYKRNAKERGIEWNLPESLFIELINGNCHYCGSPPAKRMLAYVLRAYNGVDRQDNSKGYAQENVVSCCFTCNRAKSTLTLEEFEAWIDGLMRHRMVAQ